MPLLQPRLISLLIDRKSTSLPTRLPERPWLQWRYTEEDNYWIKDYLLKSQIRIHQPEWNKKQNHVKWIHIRKANMTDWLMMTTQHATVRTCLVIKPCILFIINHEYSQETTSSCTSIYYLECLVCWKSHQIPNIFVWKWLLSSF